MNYIFSVFVFLFVLIAAQQGTNYCKSLIVLSKIGDELDFRIGPGLRFRHPGLGKCRPPKPHTIHVTLRFSRISVSPPNPNHPIAITMATRSSGNTTALRRLMTEYKQLTASGLSVCAVVLRDLADLVS